PVLLVGDVWGPATTAARLLPALRILTSDPLLVSFGQWPVRRGHTVVGGAMEHRQLRRFFRDFRHRLDARRSGADHPHTCPRERWGLGGPLCGVEGPTGEVAESRYRRGVWFGR